MENDALKARIAEFEAAKEKRGLLRRKKASDGQDHFEDVENRIIDAYEKIAKLEAEREIKDRQISTLKNEVTTLRMKDIANGKTENTSATQFDTDLLRSPAARTDFAVRIAKALNIEIRHPAQYAPGQRPATLPGKGGLLAHAF